MKQTLDDAMIRQFARNGARDVAVRIVTEFPDILAELNALATRKTYDDAARKREALKRVKAIAGPEKTEAPRGAWTPAKRKAHSLMMKRRWAAKRQEA